MKLAALYEASGDRSDDEWEAHEQAIEDLIATVRETIKHKFGFDASYAAVRTFLTGGDSDDFEDFMHAMIKHGYDEEATTFRENEQFWKSIGVSEADYKTVCEF